MESKFLGVPLVVWGVVCLVIAAVFVFVWPHDRVADTSGLRYMLVRWGHALVWLLLASSCFVRVVLGRSGAGLANNVAFAALIVYVSFLAAMFVRS